jgi:hypothetical protein
MATTAKPRPIAAPHEREGYEVEYGAMRHRVGYSVEYGGPLNTGRFVEAEPWWKRPATEARLGLITFGGGLIWATKVETIQISNVLHLLLTPGPIETAAIGALVWLHAKWRKSVRLK